MAMVDVKGFKIKRSPGRLLLRPKFFHIYWTGRPIRTSKLVRRLNMRYQLQRPDIKACEVWFLHASGGIPCRPDPAARQFVKEAVV